MKKIWKECNTLRLKVLLITSIALLLSLPMVVIHITFFVVAITSWEITICYCLCKECFEKLSLIKKVSEDSSEKENEIINLTIRKILVVLGITIVIFLIVLMWLWIL